MYKIDSCFEKLRQKNNVCNQQSYHTVCKNPIVDRRLLTHSDYLKMLSTPKGYKWQGMTSYYNHDTERWNNTHQQKMHNRKTNAAQKKTDKNLSIEQKEKAFDDSLNADANESKNKLSKKLQKENYASKSNHKDENNSAENLNKIKERETFDLLMEKKQLWLQSKKKHRREEKDKKLKSALQAKKNALAKHKKEMEEKIKLKIKRKQTLEEKRRKQKSVKEKEENAKRQALAEREMYEQRAELRKETEKYLRLEALKLEAEQIIDEEETWKNKINKAYALKMGNTKHHKLSTKNIGDDNAMGKLGKKKLINSKHHELSTKNIGNDNAMGKLGKKRLTQYINNLLNAIKQNDQVFDPGNLMKQIIRKELKKDEIKQVKLKKRLAPFEKVFDINKNTSMVKTEDQCNLPKNITLKTKYGTGNTAIQSKNKITIKLFDHSQPNQYKKMLTCKTHNVHGYNTSLFNNVCRWKTEVDHVKTKMQNCRHNLIQKAKDHNMWEQKIFS